MRFGNLFGRKTEAAVDTELRARMQHYQFAHRFLPDVAHQQGAGFLTEFVGESAQDTLLAMWNWLGERVPENERARPDGLNVEVRLHAPYAIVLFTLPPPQAITEAYFTAVAIGPFSEDVEEDANRSEETGETEEVVAPAVRYLTLEYSLDLPSEDKRTVLGEWAYGEGGSVTHLNMGTGPEPDLDVFYNRVCVMLG